MIDFKVLKTEYERNTGVTLFDEEGELQDFYREVNQVHKPVCGTWHVNPMPLTAVKRPFCGIATVDITVLSHPDMWEATRDSMNNAAAVLNGTSRELSKDGVFYSVSYNCQTCSVANRVFDANIGHGEVYEIRQQISFIIIESGVSSYDTYLYIDGLQVPFLSLVENKIHTTSILASHQGVAQTMSEAEAYGIDFVVPYMKDDVGGVLRDVIDRSTGNDAHCVVIDSAGRKSCHIMQFTHVSSNVQPPQNIGMNVSMTELHPLAAKYNALWTFDTVSKDFVSVSAVALGSSNLDSVVIFWGDGTAEAYAEGATAMHAYSDGEATHDIVMFKNFTDSFIPVAVGGNYFGRDIYFRASTRRIYAKDYADNDYKTLIAGVGGDLSIAWEGIVVFNDAGVGEEPRYRFTMQKGTFVSYIDKVDENGDYYIESGTSVNCVFGTVDTVSEDNFVYVSAKDDAVQSAKAGGMIG